MYIYKILPTSCLYICVCVCTHTDVHIHTHRVNYGPGSTVVRGMAGGEAGDIISDGMQNLTK